MPFFNEAVAVDELGRLHGDDASSKYAGCRIDDDIQTVVLFMTHGTSQWTGDNPLVYGHEEGGNVEMSSTTFGVDGSGEWSKASAFKLRGMNSAGRFEFISGNAGRLDVDGT
jgi:hypothetical protein